MLAHPVKREEVVRSATSFAKEPVLCLFELAGRAARYPLETEGALFPTGLEGVIRDGAVDLAPYGAALVKLGA